MQFGVSVSYDINQIIADIISMIYIYIYIVMWQRTSV